MPPLRGGPEAVEQRRVDLRRGCTGKLFACTTQRRGAEVDRSKEWDKQICMHYSVCVCVFGAQRHYRWIEINCFKFEIETRGS